MDVQRDVPYGPHPGQVFDLYLPRTDRPKLIIFLHGGGWTHGSHRNARPIAGYLTQAGFAVASVEYRKLPTVQPRRLVQDCADGIAHVLYHAAERGVDATGAILCGHSAGGHLAALLLANPAYLRRAGTDVQRLAGMIALDGIFDLSSAQLDRHMKVAGVRVGTGPTAKLSFSPLHLIAGVSASSRFLLLHGDRPQYTEQARAFEAALLQRGRSVHRHAIPGLSHMELTTRFGTSGTNMEEAVTAWLAEPRQP